MESKNHFITVDDEESIRRILKLIAKKVDPVCEVYDAKDGNEGYSTLEDLSKKDILGKIFMITDHGMPDKMGLDMLREIRDMGLAKKFGDKLRTYMVFSENRGYGEEIGRTAVEEGLVEGYFMKPADLSEIKSTLEKHFTS